MWLFHHQEYMPLEFAWAAAIFLPNNDTPFSFFFFFIPEKVHPESWTDETMLSYITKPQKNWLDQANFFLYAQVTAFYLKLLAPDR